MRKKNGKVRQIHAPNAQMKDVQRGLLTKFLYELDDAECVGAYVPDRDLNYTVDQHVAKDVVISTDLHDFFPSTRRSWVAQFCRDTLLWPEDAVTAFTGLTCVEFRTPGGRKHGLPQGAPTSGAIANHVAYSRLDVPMLEMLHAQGLENVAYTRYADDLTISYDGWLPQKEFDALMLRVADVIEASGYREHRKKRRVMTSRSARGATPRVLGMSAHVKRGIPRAKYRRLRARVHNAVTSGDAAAIATLEAELVYWKTVNEDQAGPLLQRIREEI